MKKDPGGATGPLYDNYNLLIIYDLFGSLWSCKGILLEALRRSRSGDPSILYRDRDNLINARDSELLPEISQASLDRLPRLPRLKRDLIVSTTLDRDKTEDPLLLFG